jgi:hypothetical protein
MLFSVAIFFGCYDTPTKKPPSKKNRFVYRETIVKGKDTGMIKLGVFKRLNIADNLCQRWRPQTSEYDMSAPVNDDGLANPTEPDIVFFKDSTVLLNPFGKIKLGHWNMTVNDKSKILNITIQNKTRQFPIRKLSSNKMVLVMPESPTINLIFAASGQVHQNMLSDPFHPSNNQWRIKPTRSETDSEIHDRIKNCLLFFALYYRDNIKRNSETISFHGLPDLFEWYNGGIGLPDPNELPDSWIQCFYDEKQALQGYAILRKLIVDYEFNWLKGAPNWIYRTHSVLEQMYHKVDDLRGLKN